MFKRYSATVLLSLVARFAFPQCGIERWPVKVGTDSDIGLVNTVVPLPVTIAYLHGLAAPRPLPQSSRIAPVETTTYSVTATLVEFKLEDDSDYHLVLADEAGRTIIAEIPSPACASGSALAAQISAARSAFDARFRATSTFQRAMVPIEIRGAEPGEGEDRRGAGDAFRRTPRHHARARSENRFARSRCFSPPISSTSSSDSLSCR